MDKQYYFNVLKQCNFFNKFMRNLCRHRNFNYDEAVRFLNSRYVNMWIISAFSWEDTLEKHNFWSTIHACWGEYCRTSDIQYLKQYIYTKPDLSIF